MTRNILNLIPIVVLMLCSSCSQKMSSEDFKKLKEMGIEQAKNGKFSQAIETLDKASSSNPEDSEIYPYLAESYEKLDQIEKAIETWQKYVFISPRNSPEAKKGLAKLNELESLKKRRVEAD